MNRDKTAMTQSMSTNDSPSRGKELVAVAGIFFIRSMVWFASDYHWPRHPDKFWVIATFEASMILGAIGILQWRSELHKLTLLDCAIALTCASLLIWGLFAIYP